MQLSQRASKLKPSPTLALAAKAKELQAQGHDVLSLSVGEPDWDTFEVAKAAGIEAIQKGQSKYTPSQGTVELRKAILAQTQKEIGQSYGMNEVTVSTGGKFIIFSALQTALNPGDEVIIPAPYWVSYPTMVELAEGVPVIPVCKKESGFKLTPEILRKHLTPKTKMLILNSPSNPTGVRYSAKELRALADVLVDAPNVLILSDDIYNRLVFTSEVNAAGLKVAPHILQVAPELKSRTLLANGAAKTFSMTGWRVGWALGPANWIEAMTNYQSQSVSCAASMAQAATVKALEAGEPELSVALKELERRKLFVLSAFSKVPGLSLQSPDGAFYVWPDVTALFGRSYNGKVLKTSSDVSQALLEDQKVVAVPGIEFGLEGYLRLSYVLKDQRIQEAADRITKFVKALQ